MIRRHLITLVMASLAWPALAEPLRLAVAYASASVDAATGQPVIDFRMTEDSAKAFAELTAANVGRTMELRIDGKTVLAPVIREPILGGSGQISGGLDGVDVDALARRLANGHARMEVEIVGD